MSTITPSRPRVRVFRVGHEYALLVVLCQNVLVGPMMGDDDVDDVGDDVLSCPGSYYCFSPTLLPTRRELKLNCSRSHQSSVLERSYSETEYTVVHAFLHLEVSASHIRRYFTRRYLQVGSSARI